jgi:hypothetical protein
MGGELPLWWVVGVGTVAAAAVGEVGGGRREEGGGQTSG